MIGATIARAKTKNWLLNVLRLVEANDNDRRGQLALKRGRERRYDGRGGRQALQPRRDEAETQEHSNIKRSWIVKIACWFRAEGHASILRVALASAFASLGWCVGFIETTCGLILEPGAVRGIASRERREGVRKGLLILPEWPFRSRPKFRSGKGFQAPWVFSVDPKPPSNSYKK